MNGFLKFILLLFLNFIIIQTSYSNIDSLKQEFSVQTGNAQFKTGLLISASLVDKPYEMLNFSLKLMNTADYIAPNTFIQAEIARSVADAYWYLDSISQSNEYLHKALAIAESQLPLDTLFVGSVYNDIGFNDKDMGKRIEAREHFNKAIKYLEGSDYYELADAMSNLASLNLSEGKYQEAISMHLEVYQLDLKTGMKDRQSTSLDNIGKIYVDCGKYERGLEYYFQSVALLDTVKDIRYLGIRYNNIGLAYQQMGNYNLAIKFLEKAIQKEEIEGKSLLLANSYANLGKVYMIANDYTQAEKYLKKAESFYSGTELFAQASKVFVCLGQLNHKMGFTEKAEIYFLKSEELAEKGGSLPEIVNCYDKLYHFYKEIGNYNKALHFIELHTPAEDSIFNLNVSQQVEEMEAQFQSKHKEAVITRLERENELKIKEILYKSKQSKWALTGLLFLLFVSFIMFLLFSTVKRQKVEFVLHNRELDRLNQTLNRLFAIISHDLRNATSAYQNSAKIIELHLGEKQPEKLLPLTSEIRSNANYLSSMLENLLQWSVSQIKGIEPRKQLLVVKDELDKIVTLLKSDAEKKFNEIKIRVENEDTVWCDQGSYNMIVRNLLGNALKYTENGIIQIEASSSLGYSLLKISDTGCGIPPSILDGIFKIGNEKIRLGTMGEKGTGLGLILVAEHVEKNGGIIRVESEEYKGTTFYVELPFLSINEMNSLKISEGKIKRSTLMN